nr:hypothetical protein [Tanacetum cinerariifolium]
MIYNMDSIGKYMIEITVHQQRTPQLLKQKKLTQTQDHSNPIQALNVNSLKVDLVVIQNTCSEKEDSNSETTSSKLVKECNLDFAINVVHAIKYKMSKAKERCMAYFRSLHSHLQVLSKEDLKGTRIEHGFKQAFMSLFGQDADTFTRTMFLNVDQLQKQLDKDEFQEDGSMAAFWVCFVEYSGIEVKHFIVILLQHMGNVKKSVAKRIVDTKFTKTSVLGKPVLQSLRNQSVVRQPNVFKSERPQMSKQRFASLVDANNNLSRPVTQHYFPKRREFVFAKPDHMIASSESRNSSKNMLRFSSNDMVHNHYLDEARKKTQERDRNSKTSVMTSARFRSTADGSKPKPRSNNQTSRSFPVSKSSRVTITDVITLREVNSRAKSQSHKTRNINKLVEQKSRTQKPGRQIFTGHMFSPNKTSAVYEKTSPISDLSPQRQENVPKAVEIVTTSNKLDLLFSLMFDELLSVSTQVVSKPFVVTTADATNQRQQKHTTPSTSTTIAEDTPLLNIQTTPATTCQEPTQAPTITTIENNKQAETITENAQVENDEFINIFCTLVKERGNTSSHHVDSSNMHTFYQRHTSKHRWTKDHPLEQVIRNPS